MNAMLYSVGGVGVATMWKKSFEISLNSKVIAIFIHFTYSKT